MLRLIACITFGVAALLANTSTAALITNMAMPITHTVTVQPIIVSNGDGTNTAEYFGNVAQTGIIQGLVNTIWAQAGIEVNFLAANTWNHTFANIGNQSPRPTGDLAIVAAAGEVAGVGNANPLVLDVYFVEIAAGFADVGENTANGLANVGFNGITQHVGDSLVSSTSGQELVASVVSHEIGHNLGLPHLVPEEVENLMLVSSSPLASGERLNAMQISSARSSQFAISAVPEPSSIAVLSFAMLVRIIHQRRVVSSKRRKTVGRRSR